MRYVALLRAVNVGGRKVEMARLRRSVEELGIEKVATYIASGNLFFDAPRQSTQKLTARLEEQIAATFGFDVPVILRTLGQLRAVVAGDPFAGVEVTEDVRLTVNFLAGRPSRLQVPQCSPKGDVGLVGLTAGEAYLVIRLTNGRWPSGTWPGKELGVASTARFWHTTAKILTAAEKKG